MKVGPKAARIASMAAPPAAAHVALPVPLLGQPSRDPGREEGPAEAVVTLTSFLPT